MNLLKKFLALFLASALIISVLPFNAEAASVFGKQKKNIFFVMDDSGSMDNSKQHDANYSLQTLLAMCDKEDVVNLYFLNSRPNSPQVLNMNSKDTAMIDNVRQSYPKSNGGTPYNAVSVAQKQLADAARDGDETSYWLVVLTDGGFDSGSVNPATDLTNFSNKTLANGTKPNVLFISIGGAVTMKSQGTLHYISGSNIIDAMDEAAKLISGRIDIEPTYSAGNKDITFNVPYPARNIVVLTQNNDVNIVGHKASAGLNTSEKFNIVYPVKSQVAGNATVCFIKDANGSSISNGQVTLSFDKPLDSKSTTVLVEPAIGLSAHFYNQDGQEVDPSSLCNGETARVEYALCDSETKHPLDNSLFGGKVKYHSNINGKDYDTNSFDFTIDTSSLKIDMYAELPDGYVLDIHNTYDNLSTKRDVTLSLSNSGNFSADIKQVEGAPGIVASVLINGNPATPEQFENFDLEVKGTNFLTKRISLERDEANGAFIIHPKLALLSILTPYNETYEVVLTDKLGSPQSATLVVDIPGDRDWIDVIIKCLIALLIIWMIICQIFKKRFPFGTAFLVYNGYSPNDLNGIQPKPIYLFELYWHEFLSLFSGNFTSLLHLLEYFFTPRAQKLMLFRIGNGWFKQFTFVADGSGAMYVKDRNFARYKKNPERYKPDFKKYDVRLRCAAGQNYKQDEIPLGVGELLSKEQNNYKIYVRFTTRKVLRRNPYARNGTRR